MTLAEKFEKAQHRKLERARVQGVKQGVKQGLREGQRKGLEIGQRKGMCSTLLNQLGTRFGGVPHDVRQKLDTASTAQINRWALRLLDAATLDDVFKRGHRNLVQGNGR